MTVRIHCFRGPCSFLSPGTLSAVLFHNIGRRSDVCLHDRGLPAQLIDSQGSRKSLHHEFCPTIRALYSPTSPSVWLFPSTLSANLGRIESIEQRVKAISHSGHGLSYICTAIIHESIVCQSLSQIVRACSVILEFLLTIKRSSRKNRTSYFRDYVLLTLPRTFAFAFAFLPVLLTLRTPTSLLKRQARSQFGHSFGVKIRQPEARSSTALWGERNADRQSLNATCPRLGWMEEASARELKACERALRSAESKLVLQTLQEASRQDLSLSFFLPYH